MEKYRDANSNIDLKAIADIRDAIKYLGKGTRIAVLKFCLEIEQGEQLKDSG